MTQFYGKCQNLQRTPTHICARSYRFGDIQIFNICSLKRRLRSWNALLTIAPFDGKFFNLQTSFLHVWFLLRYDMCSWFEQTHRYTDTQTHRNGQAHSCQKKIVQICLIKPFLRLVLFKNLAMKTHIGTWSFSADPNQLHNLIR